jgi:hypothetical protein
MAVLQLRVLPEVGDHELVDLPPAELALGKRSFTDRIYDGD